MKTKVFWHVLPFSLVNFTVLLNMDWGSRFLWNIKVQSIMFQNTVILFVC